MECGSLAGLLAARAISNRRNPVEITLKIEIQDMQLTYSYE